MRILIVDDDVLVRESIEYNIRKEAGPSSHIVKVGEYRAAADLLEKEFFDVALLDINLGEFNKQGGILLLQTIQQKYEHMVVIMMTSVNDPEVIKKCIRMGADHYVIKPFNFDETTKIITVARQFHSLIRKNLVLRVQAGDRAISPILLKTKSPLFQKVLDQAKHLKGKDIHVLISGESGAGKRSLARYLWTLEGDTSRPFVPVQRGNMPDELLEAELFGIESDSDKETDIESKTGTFTLANGGDLFLNDISAFSLELQEKILKTIESRKVVPLRSYRVIDSNCRMICTTDDNLESLVSGGLFHREFFYKIRRASLVVPPLRQRKEDIPDLINEFLKQFTGGKKTLSTNALQLCLDYSWPGNIGQLRNVIETLAIMVERTEINREDVETQISLNETMSGRIPELPAQSAALALPFGVDDKTIKGNYRNLSTQFEQNMVKLAVKLTGSENAGAAYLGIPRTTLRSIRKNWGWGEPVNGEYTNIT